MKTLREYIAETENWIDEPAPGDDFAIDIREGECLIESYVVETTNDGVIIQGDERLLELLEEYGYEMEEIRRYGPAGNSRGMGGATLSELELTDDEISPKDHLDAIENDHVGETTDSFDRMLELAGCNRRMENANENDPLLAKAIDDAPVGALEEDPTQEEPIPAAPVKVDVEMDEAEYQGRTVQLNKPMKGDVKKSKVYVKGPKGNVVKVNFGDPNMRIKKSNPARRKSFRARHNCDNPGPKWKARYWSCRAW